MSDGDIIAFGVVIIGRNEGDRLRKCLDSVIRVADSVVYVDSGSTDGSVAVARGNKVTVVALDMGLPFTAARARNEGFKRLRDLAPHIDYVQFVDGDCEITKGWLKNATNFLRGHEDVAVVCGRLREKYPERSIYNMLCDIEWDIPAGDAKSCGGIAMMRVSAFESMRGFRNDMIAGEEPELCVRLRKSGWKIWRLADDMGHHDAAMLRFGQWWKRAVRTGYAFALGAHLHGAPPEQHKVRESRSTWFWGLVIPLGGIFLATLGGPWAFLLFLLYPLQIIRLAMRGGRPIRENWLYAVFLILGKFPEMLGQMMFVFHRFLRTESRLIEYK